MDETELHEIVDKIIKVFVWLSTNIDNNVDAETLACYCKRTNDERTRKKLICEYLKVVDSSFYISNQLLERGAIKKY